MNSTNTHAHSHTRVYARSHTDACTPARRSPARPSSSTILPQLNQFNNLIKGSSDPYVKAKLVPVNEDHPSKKKTSIKMHMLNPVWDEELQWELDDYTNQEGIYPPLSIPLCNIVTVFALLLARACFLPPPRPLSPLPPPSLPPPCSPVHLPLTAVAALDKCDVSPCINASACSTDACNRPITPPSPPSPPPFRITLRSRLALTGGGVGLGSAV